MEPRRFLATLASLAIAAAAGFWLLRPAPILVETAPAAEGRFIATVVVE